MERNTYGAAVVRQLVRRLHAGAAEGRRCRCGACRREVLVTATRLGVAVRRLDAALPPERLSAAA